MPSANENYVFPPFGNSPEQVSKYKTAAPWPEESVAFTLANLCYPFPHTHEYYEILVVLSGSFLHTVNGTQFIMNVGDCCLIRPDDRHWHSVVTSQSSEPILYANFMCSKSALDQIISVYPQAPLPAVNEDSTPLSYHLSSSYINKLKRLCMLLQTPSTAPTPEKVIQCTAVVAELIHSCIRNRASSPTDNYPQWLQSLILTLQNPDFFTKKVSDITSNIPYSYSYIQRQFKQYVGIPPIEYLNSIKLAYAKEMLTSTTSSIITIANSLGFDSPAHFNHLFKKAFGITPSQYRKQTSVVSTVQ